MMDVVISVFIDFLIGDPPSFPHPVKLMGRIISYEEKKARKVFNKNLKTGGFLIVIINIIIGFFIPFFILYLLKPYKILYHIVNIYFIYTCIAARCLHDEAIKVYKALCNSIEDARYRLSFIVGRETGKLSEPEIIRADVETVAENTSDGVIAPLFYIMLFGTPLGFVYKFVNTMDSMLGYMNEKYIDLGFFPAKTDDLFNFIPARLTGFLMCISCIFRFDFANGIRIMLRDRKNHKSPNCAYPEGAAAGLLGVQLGGDNIYFGQVVKKPKIGDKLKELDKEDIKKTTEIMYRSEILLVLIWILINCCFKRF
jgi:adenosylcobinamide-phosphate synthase